MKRPLQPLEKLSHVVIAEAWTQSHRLRLHLERLRRCSAAAQGETQPEKLIDGLLERAAGAARFALELGSHIIFEGQSRSHIMMLKKEHLDVKYER